MAPPRKDVPSLADLRRKSSRRSAPVPTLFDLVPAVEEGQGSRVEGLDAPERFAPIVLEQPVEVAEPKIWTVGALVRQVRGLVERSYGAVSVEGEISNWRPAASGHCYFTLKDGTAQLSIVMFRAQAARLKFRPKDGDAVRLSGQLSVYESRGQMQLVAERMEQVGLGAMLAAVRELKEKLRREGLFENKRPLPSFPKCIGVVTSVQGAALRDIVKVCRRRHAAVNLLIYPAAVQGPNCAREVAAGVRWFSAHKDRADVVIVARGGGSWEDLHGFDAEEVARAIAGCSVPVVVGVGHATDTTIADAAADVCAPTPSAAAELVTAAQFKVEERVLRLEARVLRAGRFEMLRVQHRFAPLSAERLFRRVRDVLGRKAQRVDELEYRGEGAVRRVLRAREEKLARLEVRLRRRHVSVVLAADRRRLEMLQARLLRVSESVVASRAARVESARVRLEALSPLRVLERGYALVYDAEGKLLRDASAVKSGEEIVARLRDGRVRARVLASEK